MSSSLEVPQTLPVSPEDQDAFESCDERPELILPELAQSQQAKPSKSPRPRSPPRLHHDHAGDVEKDKSLPRSLFREEKSSVEPPEQESGQRGAVRAEPPAVDAPGAVMCRPHEESRADKLPDKVLGREKEGKAFSSHVGTLVDGSATSLPSTGVPTSEETTGNNEDIRIRAKSPSAARANDGRSLGSSTKNGGTSHNANQTEAPSSISVRADYNSSAPPSTSSSLAPAPSSLTELEEFIHDGSLAEIRKALPPERNSSRSDTRPSRKSGILVGSLQNYNYEELPRKTLSREDISPRTHWPSEQQLGGLGLFEGDGINLPSSTTTSVSSSSRSSFGGTIESSQDRFRSASAGAGTSHASSLTTERSWLPPLRGNMNIGSRSPSPPLNMREHQHGSDHAAEDSLRARVPDLLEGMNRASERTNEYERRAADARKRHASLLNQWKMAYRQMRSVRGREIDLARPFFEQEERKERSELEMYHALQGFTDAQEVHETAKEDLRRLEEAFGGWGAHEVRLEIEEQEAVSRQTLLIMSAQQDRDRCEQVYAAALRKFVAACDGLEKRRGELGSWMVEEIRPLFRQMVYYQQSLSGLDQEVADMEAHAAQARLEYQSALRGLEKINEDIHELRAAGAGAAGRCVEGKEGEAEGRGRRREGKDKDDDVHIDVGGGEEEDAEVW
eukprot:CAMPEP_0178999322 /NCGR_PEP_ID=MMETSP0795-20121207/9987_1 /TAXON_ID=88552 /ORGANISM="Amoebophrya sp., Strain Ameob2" /LENGTH=674 /DNA_ID=CAMNT_0020692065 /DNA_START=92 /DNA_END=2113 /DNA_ORIENTATION=+